MSHKFQVGQVVMFTPSDGELAHRSTKSSIVRLLPKEGVDYQYHVLVVTGGLMRRAWESQLRASTGDA